MRIRLVYEGPLQPTQNPRLPEQFDALAPLKHHIRQVMHKQLREFWTRNRFLRDFRADNLEYGSLSPLEQSAIWTDGPSENARSLVNLIAEEYSEYGYQFVPLVCEWTKTLCNLDILLLRRDFPPEKIEGPLWHGDLDNRVKTLIDALCKPSGSSQLRNNEEPGVGEDPFYCLLQDDKLVSGLTVETDTLLLPPKESEDMSYVCAIVTADIKPYQITGLNLGFA